jgi:hypothetical protein
LERTHIGRPLGKMFGFDLSAYQNRNGKRWISVASSHQGVGEDNVHRLLVEPSTTAVGTVERIRGELKRLDVAKDSETAVNDRTKRDLEEMQGMNTEFAGAGRMGEINTRLTDIDNQLLGRRPSARPALINEIAKSLAGLGELLRGTVVLTWSLLREANTLDFAPLPRVSRLTRG